MTAKRILIQEKYIENSIPVIRAVCAQTGKKEIYYIEDKKKIKKLSPECVVIKDYKDHCVIVPEKLYDLSDSE